ncbi:MAG TPA: hypothetical protein VMU94_11335 [Streptosporangiaceae bacterium]|nr:hypothetical protein [Streptosporangiaceae bacterium]
MTDVLICLDYAHDPGREREWCFDGPKDEPVWALYLVTADESADEGMDERHVASGITYTAAWNLARSLGYMTDPIGASPRAAFPARIEPTSS